MKKTYYVTITETLNRVIKVEAEDETSALCFIEDKYNDGEIVLDYNDFVDVEIKNASDEDTQIYKQNEFIQEVK